MKNNKIKKNKKGFTLTEIMIVVAIIGLLAAIAIPSFIKARTNSMDSICINNLRQIDSAKDQYAMDNDNQAPADLDALVPTYIKKMPDCPAEGTYSLETLDTSATCSEGGGHVL